MVNLISIGCILWVWDSEKFQEEKFGIRLLDRDFQVRQLPRTCLILTVVTFIVIVEIEFLWYQSLLFMLHCHPGKSANWEMTLCVSFNWAHLVSCRFTSCTFWWVYLYEYNNLTWLCCGLIFCQWIILVLARNFGHFVQIMKIWKLV